MRFLIAVWGVLLAVCFASSVPGFQLKPEPTTSPRYQRFIEDLFSRYDKDGDGAIQASEHEHIHYPLLDQADTDQDGKVTPEEILAIVAPVAPQTQQKKARQNPSTSRRGRRIVGGASPGSRNSLRGGIILDPNTGSGAGDILGGLANLKSGSVDRSIPETVDISFIALELPDDFAKKEMVTLKEMAVALSDGGMKESELEKIGIRLLDLCEFSSVEGVESSLKFGQSTTIQESNSNTRTQSGRNTGLGSTLSVTPRVHDESLVLDLNYSTTAINKHDRGFRRVGYQSRLLFDNENRSKLTNLYNDGVHYLLIVTAKTK